MGQHRRVRMNNKIKAVLFGLFCAVVLSPVGAFAVGTASTELTSAVTVAKDDAVANINAAIPIMAVLFALIISIYAVKKMVKNWSK